MKKTITALALLMCFSASFAQNSQRALQKGINLNTRPCEAMAQKSDVTRKLSAFISTDNVEKNHYFYNDQHQLIAHREQMIGADGYLVYDSMFYNAQGQMIKLSGWQHFSDGSIKNVYYMDYTYDAAGNLASRSNYNMYQGEWYLGATINYTYNENHQITGSSYEFFGTTHTETYTYTDGLLTKYTYLENDMPLQTNTYIYTDGKVSQVVDSVYDEYEFAWSYNGEETYEYNENGDCTKYSKFNPNGNEVNRRVYAYEDQLLSNTLMPWEPEMTRPFTYTNIHTYTTEESWLVDEDNRLRHFCDYQYYYIGINDADLSVKDVAAAPIVLYPNPTTSFVTLTGIEQPMLVTISDLQGRTLIQQQTHEGATIDMSHLGKGIYMVRLEDGRISKLIVR